MNLDKIYKAIDEGLKQSLIDFGNNKILKSSLVNNRLISEQDIDDWYESGEDMPEDLYKELCNNMYIGFYIIEDNELLNNIFKRIKFENINLNWINISNLTNILITNIKYKYNLDIQYWNIDKMSPMFASNFVLTSIKIPNSVTSIEESAFCGCKALTSIHIPDSITSIGDDAFYYCTSLTSIHIPDSITSIGDDAFYYCTSLTSINIPNNVTRIGSGVFQGCKSLKSIKIPNNITSINSRVFFGCVSLKTIEIPNGVTTIEEEAFYSCVLLETINIPNSITNIESYAFASCQSLTTINYDGTIKLWKHIKRSKEAFLGVTCTVYCLDGDIKINN